MIESRSYFLLVMYAYLWSTPTERHVSQPAWVENSKGGKRRDFQGFLRVNIGVRGGAERGDGEVGVAGEVDDGGVVAQEV